MRKDSALLGGGGVVIGVLFGILLRGLTCVPEDGNPIGFHAAGAPSSKGPAASTVTGCLESKSCKSIEIHVLQLPVTNCPASGPGTTVCLPKPGSAQVLPDCNGAQCITFTSTVGKGEMSIWSADTTEWHDAKKVDAEAIIILK
jgi:hypothetical protein